MSEADITRILDKIDNLGDGLRESIAEVHARLDESLKDCRARHNGTNLQSMDDDIKAVQISLTQHLAASGGERETSHNWGNYLIAVGMLIIAAISAYGAFVK